MRLSLQSMIVCTIVFVSLPSIHAQSAGAVLSMRGDLQKSLQWSVDDLKATFSAQAKEVKFSGGMDKATHSGTGVPLLSLIQGVALKTDPSVKHHDMKFVVIVEAHDGYRVFFSLAELLPQAGHAEAWLLWEVDGKPLSGKEAPLRMVVSTDKAADRAIFGVTQIILVDRIKVAEQMKGN